MIRMIVKVDGMACSMCEAHVNEAIRKAVPVKKVTSSHKKGETQLILENPVDEQAIKQAIESIGYRVISVESGPYEKKDFGCLGNNNREKGGFYASSRMAGDVFPGTTLGAAGVFFLRRTLPLWVQRALTGFAAGVMVAASIWSLLLPAMEQGST